MPSGAIKSLEQRKQDVLKRIQENFLCQVEGSLPSFLKEYEGDSERTDQKTVKHFVQSFIPQSHDIKPKEEDHKKV